jgi:hypothetical protein
MKKRFLIPTLGVFAFAMAFTFSISSNNGESAIFIDSDNIAYAKASISSGAYCEYRIGYICSYGGFVMTNAILVTQIEAIK